MFFDDLEAKRAERATTNRATLPPAILAFANEMRRTFGDGVRLLKGKDWPGGSNDYRR